jgi:hypothetical protein
MDLNEEGEVGEEFYGDDLEEFPGEDQLEPDSVEGLENCDQNTDNLERLKMGSLESNMKASESLDHPYLTADDCEQERFSKSKARHFQNSSFGAPRHPGGNMSSVYQNSMSNTTPNLPKSASFSIDQASRADFQAASKETSPNKCLDSTNGEEELCAGIRGDEESLRRLLDGEFCDIKDHRMQNDDPDSLELWVQIEVEDRVIARLWIPIHQLVPQEVLTKCEAGGFDSAVCVTLYEYAELKNFTLPANFPEQCPCGHGVASEKSDSRTRSEAVDENSE